VLDESTRTCAAHGRADLVSSLRQRRAQLLDPQLRVLVVGEPKQGKSQLINALLNATVCAVGDGASSRVATVVQHAAAPSAYLVGARTDRAGPEDRSPVPIERIAEGIDADPDGLRAGGPAYAEIGLPRALLAAGLALIEAPAVDGADAAPAVEALATRVRADTAILVSAATHELSDPELALLARLAKLYPSVLVALTKIDIAVDWRRVLDRNGHRLVAAGVAAKLVPVSAALRLHAARTGDQALNAESGFPHLTAYLREAVSAKGDRLARTAVALLGRSVVHELAAPLQAELAAQTAGETSDAMSRLHDAQRRVDELRRCTVRWQNTLSDELTAMIADIEHDLRERTRAILRRADETLDESDPAREWETFERWLDAALLDTAEANFSRLVERIESVAGRLAGQFPDGVPADGAPQWTVDLLDDIPGRVHRIDRPAVERFTLSQKVFSGLRGSYGGVLMFGLATSLAGWHLINPVSLSAGALFAGKSIYDDSRSVRKRRQAAVKAAVQRHVDDVFLKLSKDTRDTIRYVQGVLRDHFGALTDELQQAIVESARTAKQAADTDAAVRDHRAQRIQRELMRLAGLYQQAQALTTARGVVVPTPRRPTA
jgi:hypothetical protein